MPWQDNPSAIFKTGSQHWDYCSWSWHVEAILTVFKTWLVWIKFWIKKESWSQLCHTRTISQQFSNLSLSIESLWVGLDMPRQCWQFSQLNLGIDHLDQGYWSQSWNAKTISAFSKLCLGIESIDLILSFQDNFDSFQNWVWTNRVWILVLYSVKGLHWTVFDKSCLNCNVSYGH